MSNEKKVFKVGSRKSELALIQTRIVIESLQEIYPKCSYDIVTMDTMGDQILDKPLPKIGEKSLFTKELESALQNGDVDLVVHSLKDMPTSLPPGLAIGAILEREDPRDAVLLNSKHRGKTLDKLPENTVIGTSSLRRTAQLKRKYPHLIIKDIRGNLQTRLKKLDQKVTYDGIVLAAAGVRRMAWEHRLSQVLEEDEMLYAVGQGALAVECRQEDCHLLATLSHEDTLLRTTAERSLLSTLGGGCSAPVAVSSKLAQADTQNNMEHDNGSVGDTTSLSHTLTLTAAVWSLDGTKTLERTLHRTLHQLENMQEEKVNYYCGVSDCGIGKEKIKLASALGVDLANELIKEGALEIISEAKAINEKATLELRNNS